MVERAAVAEDRRPWIFLLKGTAPTLIETVWPPVRIRPAGLMPLKKEQVMERALNILLATILIVSIMTIYFGPESLPVLSYLVFLSYAVVLLISLVVASVNIVSMFYSSFHVKSNIEVFILHEWNGVIKILSIITILLLLINDIFMLIFSTIFYKEIITSNFSLSVQENVLPSYISVLIAFLSLSFYEKREKMLGKTINKKSSQKENFVFIISIILLSISAIVSSLNEKLNPEVYQESIFILTMYYLFSGVLIPWLLLAAQSSINKDHHKV